MEHLIGDYCGFIDALIASLAANGLDVLAKGYELDHICYRCSSVAQYRNVCAALVPEFGVLAVESKMDGAVGKLCSAAPTLMVVTY